MYRLYMYFNAFIYMVLAIWCAVSPAKTSRGVGYVELSSSGQSEYFVIYGGLQLGLAIVFAYLGCRTATLERLGALFSLAIYVPIVVFRTVSLLRYWPVSGITLGTAALEWVLLAGAILLFLQPGMRSGA